VVHTKKRQENISEEKNLYWNGSRIANVTLITGVEHFPKSNLKNEWCKCKGLIVSLLLGIPWINQTKSVQNGPEAAHQRLLNFCELEN